MLYPPKPQSVIGLLAISLSQFVGLLGDVDTICGLLGQNVGCGAGDMIGSDLFQAVLLVGGLLFIFWGERKHTISTMETYKDKVDSISQQLTHIRDDYDRLSLRLEAKTRDIDYCVDTIKLEDEYFDRIGLVNALLSLLPSEPNKKRPQLLMYQHDSSYKIIQRVEQKLQEIGYPHEYLTAFTQKEQARIISDASSITLSEDEKEIWHSGEEKREFLLKKSRVKLYLRFAQEPRSPHPNEISRVINQNPYS